MNSLPVLTVGALLTLAGTGVAAGATGAAAHRPAAEHIPLTVHKVTIEHARDASRGTTVRLTAKQDRHLIRVFDQLRREPRGTVHCDLAGGPTDTVRFTSRRHVWVAAQAACTNVRVTRDGRHLPTLLPDPAWEKALRHDRKADA